MVIIEWLESHTILIGALASFGLLSAIVADQVQVYVKFRGSENRIVARGYAAAMKVMVINRFGAVVFFLGIAFIIDRGADPRNLIHIYSVVYLLSSLSALFLGREILSSQLATHPRGLNQFKSTSRGRVALAFLAQIFNTSGLTLPWLAAAAYPDYRLTLANASFMINTLYTMINVFYIEHGLATLIDNRREAVGYYSYDLMVGRSAALMCSSGFVLLI